MNDSSTRTTKLSAVMQQQVLLARSDKHFIFFQFESLSIRFIFFVIASSHRQNQQRLLQHWQHQPSSLHRSCHHQQLQQQHHQLLLLLSPLFSLPKKKTRKCHTLYRVPKKTEAIPLLMLMLLLLLLLLPRTLEPHLSPSGPLLVSLQEACCPPALVALCYR
jgi:hypothetical protein